jgi:glutathionyl-hydroquinone reductase
MQKGTFERDTNYISDRITRNTQPPTVGPYDQLWPVASGRYHLVVAAACPWAHRSMIVRELLGLSDVISLGVCGPVHDQRSWTFDLDPGGVDPVLGINRIQEAYFARTPGYSRGITVPCLVDIPTGVVVTNNFPWITHDLFFEWRDYHQPTAPNLWPDEIRDEMEEVMLRIYRDLNNGVYEAGFASSQDGYETAYHRVFETLDWLELRLAQQPFLMGERLTEADIRLWTTLVRFDAVYHGHFKCNRNKLSELPALWEYARRLYAIPGFGSTTNFNQIKEHYYVVHTGINPTQIVPVGPRVSEWATLATPVSTDC